MMRFILLFLISVLLADLNVLYAEASNKFNIGKYQSRAIWNNAQGINENSKAPVVILIPGSGPQGPEEMMPQNLTSDGKEHSLFEQFSSPFNKAGIHTLALGKPGVEFFSSWEPTTWFYDKNLYINLHWKDLIDNIREAIAYVGTRKDVDHARIYLLGHSEGTQLSVDYASMDTSVSGLILLGYSGDDLATTAYWQLFERDIDNFVIPSLDKDKDGFITIIEASEWPEFQWDWKSSGKDEISIEEIREFIKNDSPRQEMYDSIKKHPLYSDGIFERGNINHLTASLVQPIYVFTGELDQQTRPEEAMELEKVCLKLKKGNCAVTIVPGVGHGFSPPKVPRKHPMLDLTLGPVTETFQETLFSLGSNICK